MRRKLDSLAPRSRRESTALERDHRVHSPVLAGTRAHVGELAVDWEDHAPYDDHAIGDGGGSLHRERFTRRRLRTRPPSGVSVHLTRPNVQARTFARSLLGSFSLAFHLASIARFSRARTHTHTLGPIIILSHSPALAYVSAASAACDLPLSRSLFFFFF